MQIPIGHIYNSKGVTDLFSGSDNPAQFKINSNVLADVGWQWLKKTIPYQYNNLGFRCDFDFDGEFDFSDYIVVVGCSHVEGVGNHNTETVPTLLSNISNEKVINMGVGGCSNEVIYQNLIWLLSRKHRPKKIIVLWTSLYRDMMHSQTMTAAHFMPHNIKEILSSENDIDRFIKLEYLTSYVERTSFHKFEMVKQMREAGVYAFNFFNKHDYSSLENQYIGDALTNDHSVGTDALRDHNIARFRLMDDANNGSINMGEYLNCYYARDLTGIILKKNKTVLVSPHAHYSGTANAIIAEFIVDNIK
jgi:hypothetical protein